jgi:error-prone DNA polymerase
LRDVGRVLQISECLIAALAHEHPGMYSRQIQQQRLQEALARLGPGFVPPPARQLALWLELASGLLGLPRHLSQHPGGFVLTQGPLTALVPVEPAAMAGRSVIQWDKDDLDALGLMKVDVLALGMLSALAQSLRLIGQQLGRPFALQDIPADDPATFEMVSAADTVGVFQIESRAQMSMLPRLKPRCFYDLVVQVAIVRPGPIQGGMVHPYLQARAHPEQVRYASPALQNALQRTLGVPIFQEQVMQIAMLAAGFTPGESDQLRRAMAAWKRKGGVSAFYERLVGGMLARGYSQEFAQRIFAQIEGFGEYGFPESHAASFALLVWASAWVKRHHPACFLVALLNSQPMGFYSPSQLVQDAQRHGVPVLPVDVCHSHWECTLEPTQAGGPPAVRLGLNRVHGLSQASAQRLVATRDAAPWRNMADLAQRAGLSGAELQCLAHADALTSLGGHRRLQLWQASAHLPVPALWQSAPPEAEPACHLPPAPLPEEVRHDYAYLGLTLRPHPLSFLREKLLKLKHLSAQQMRTLAHGRLVRSSGLVVMRQSPATAHGVTFVTLEDETGTTNVIVWRGVKARFRSTLLHARLLAVHGTWQRDEGSGGQVCHLVAGYLQDLTPLLGELAGSSRDFR